MRQGENSECELTILINLFREKGGNESVEAIQVNAMTTKLSRGKEVQITSNKDEDGTCT